MELSDWMRRVGLDDNALAARANVNRATISRLRRRRARPSPELASLLYSLTGGQVTPNDFYDLPALPDAASGDAQEAA